MQNTPAKKIISIRDVIGHYIKRNQSAVKRSKAGLIYNAYIKSSIH